MDGGIQRVDQRERKERAGDLAQVLERLALPAETATDLHQPTHQGGMNVDVLDRAKRLEIGLVAISVEHLVLVDACPLEDQFGVRDLKPQIDQQKDKITKLETSKALDEDKRKRVQMERAESNKEIAVSYSYHS